MTILTYLAIGSGLLPLFAALAFFSKRKRALLGVYLHILLCFVVDVAATSHYIFKLGNNLYLVHIFTLLETFLIGLIYKQYMGSKLPGIWVWGGVLAVWATELAQNPFGPYLFEMNSYARSLSALFIIGLVVYYFYRLLIDLEERHLLRVPMFWFSTAFLFYFSGNLILFLFSGQLIKTVSAVDGVQMFVIHSILQITKNILLSIGLWQTRLSPSSS